MKTIPEIEAEMNSLEALEFTQDTCTERSAAEAQFEQLANELEARRRGMPK